MPTISLTLPSNGDDAIVDPYNAALLAIQALLNGQLDEDNISDGSILLAKLATTVQQALTPIGAIIAYGGATAPSGFLLCYGQAISRTTYADLFAIVSTAFGVGDGATTFNLPDLRGRIPVGADNIGGSAANVSQNSTTISTTNASASATVGSASGLAVGDKIVSTNVPAGTTITVISGTTITMSANATATAAGVAARFSQFTNDAQTIGAIGGTDSHVLITAQLAAHTHTVTSPANSTAGANPNYFAGNNGGSYSPTSSSTGGDQPHPNMQPSQVVNYMIKI